MRTFLRRFAVIFSALSLGLTLFLIPATSPAAAFEDLPFTGEALPTWQTNGVVESIAGSNGKIVVGGRFSQVRPGAGQGGSTRTIQSLAIFDAATGQPDTCQLPAALSTGSPAVWAVTPSTDGRTVFVGGDFSSIGGVSISRLAEIDVVSCSVTSFRPAAISSFVHSIEVTDDAVYIGGRFQQVGGQQRRSFAKLTRSGALTSWVANASDVTESAYSQRVVANANALGFAIKVSPDGSRVVLGGDFFRVNGTSTRSLGVVDSESGELIHTYSGIVSVTSRAKSITSDDGGFYVSYEGYSGFDGKLAFNWDTLEQRWRDTCFGATQDTLVQGDLLYSAHHHHDCASLGMFPDGRRIYLSVTNKHDPGQSQLGWFPELNDGIGEGIGPRSLAVATTGGKTYLWVGGEFTRVNGASQQGLTRFGPDDTTAPPTPTLDVRAVTAGALNVSIRSVVDRSEGALTYAVYRGSNTTTPVWTGTATSRWWYQPQLTFVDTNVTPGVSYSYRVAAIDAAGNRSPLTVPQSAIPSATGSPYAQAVISDDPQLYWRYDDPAGWALDSSGQTEHGFNGIPRNGVNRSAPGALPDDNSRSATFAQGASQYIYSDIIDKGPKVFTIETWFRTTSTAGGSMVSYGNGRPRSDSGADVLSSSYTVEYSPFAQVSNTFDRVVYMEAQTGQLRFGVRAPNTVQTLRSPEAYNDGQWHHVVASQGPSGMRMYVDGELVAQNNVTQNREYWGSWRVGGDSLSGYPNTGSFFDPARYFAGQLDETAVYYHELSEQRAIAHFSAGGGTVSDDEPPEAPTDVIAEQAGNATAQVSWTAAADNIAVTGYSVHRGSTSDFEPTEGNRVAQDIGTTSYTDTGLAAGTWFYKVTARDGAGNVSSASGYAEVEISAPDESAPTVPTDLAAVVQDTDVELSWEASSDDVGVTGYVVYRGTTAGFPATTATRIAEVSDTNYTDADRPEGTWFYKVTAVDAAGNTSGASNEVTALIVLPGEPVEVTLEATADAMVAQINPAFAYGNSDQISSRGTTTIQSFLSFDLPAAPAGTELTGVAFGLRTSNDPTANSTDEHRIEVLNESWNEQTVTWNNRPTQVGAQVATLSGMTQRNFSYTFEGEAAPLRELLGQTVSFRISGQGMDNVRFISRESTNPAFRPAITLHFTPGTEDPVDPEDPEDPDESAPTAPTGVVAVVQDTDVALAWEASTDDVGVTGYVVYRGTTPGFPVDVSTRVAEVSETNYTDEGLPEGTWYYKVTATDAAGNVSSPSDPVSAEVSTPDESAPTAPTGVVAVVQDTDVALAWEASTDNVGVTGYVVYRGTTPGFPVDVSTRVAEVSETNYTDEGRPDGTWYYKVTATDAAGNVSGASNEVSAVIPPVDPGDPVEPAEPVEVTLEATADAMAAQINPAFAYGSTDQISSRGNTPIESFLSFDLPAAPEGTQLTAVTFRLRTSNDPTSDSTDEHRIDVLNEAWDEQTVTWNNRPTQIGAQVATLSGMTQRNFTYTFAGQAAPLQDLLGQTVSFRISGQGMDNVRFISRESTNPAFRPAITLHFTPIP